MLFKLFRTRAAPTDLASTSAERLTFGEKMKRVAAAAGATVAFATMPSFAGDLFEHAPLEHFGDEPAATALANMPEPDGGNTAPGPKPIPHHTPPAGTSAAADELFPNITQGEAWAKLTPEVRQKLSVVLADASPDVELPLTKLLANPAILQQRDYRGNTLLDNLYTIATEKVSQQLLDANSRWEAYEQSQGKYVQPRSVNTALLDSTVENLADPASIGQQGNLCGEGAAENAVATYAAASYATEVGGLASTAQKVVLANGSSLKLNMGQIETPKKNTANPFDTLASRLFEPAAVDNALGGRGTYNAATDKSTYGWDYQEITPPRVGQGTTLTNESRLIQNLFGEAYVASDNVHGNLDAHMAEQVFMPFLTEEPRANLDLDFLKSAAANDPNGAPILLIIQAYDKNGKPDGTHFVRYVPQDLSKTNGRLLLANPWGKGAAGSYSVYSINKEFGKSYRVEKAPGEASPSEGGYMSMDPSVDTGSIVGILAPRSTVAKADPDALQVSSLPREIETTVGEAMAAYLAVRQMLALGRSFRNKRTAKAQAKNEKLVVKNPPLPPLPPQYRSKTANLSDIESIELSPSAALPYGGTIKLRLPSASEATGDVTQE